MALKYVLGLAAAGAVVWGVSELVDDGIEGCTSNPDGGVNLHMDDGTVEHNYNWTIDYDDGNCYASNGGSTPPSSTPILDR